MRAVRIAEIGLALALATSLHGMAALAQGIDFANQQGVPVEVYADKGLELSQDAKTLIARGNARAVRGRVTVTADTLIAHYRDKNPAAAKGAAKPGAAAAKSAATTPAAAKAGDEVARSSSEIWRLEADGHVVIFTETQRAYADHADYNIDDAVVVLTGKNLRLTTPSEQVTARDSLEYWETRQQAVARGKAVATRGDKRIQGDVLVADYGQDQEKKMVLRHATAFDHVVISTANEIVTGNRADYDPAGGLVTVNGAVKMTRGENQLDGGYAVVNLNTGISRLFPAAPGQASPGDARVRGLLAPERKPGAATPNATAPGDDQPPPKPVTPQ